VYGLIQKKNVLIITKSEFDYGFLRVLQVKPSNSFTIFVRQ
jgi:hypothetical protein